MGPVLSNRNHLKQLNNNQFISAKVYIFYPVNHNGMEGGMEGPQKPAMKRVGEEPLRYYKTNLSEPHHWIWLIFFI